MGFKDKLVKQKDGSYVLSSKSKKIKKKGACIECGDGECTGSETAANCPEDCDPCFEYDVEGELTN